LKSQSALCEGHADVASLAALVALATRDAVTDTFRFACRGLQGCAIVADDVVVDDDFCTDAQFVWK
jgi:hypothetical protein